jgi:hypothetical protein
MLIILLPVIQLKYDMNLCVLVINNKLYMVQYTSYTRIQLYVDYRISITERMVKSPIKQYPGI